MLALHRVYFNQCKLELIIKEINKEINKGYVIHVLE